jgi:hypothetical protein
MSRGNITLDQVRSDQFSAGTDAVKFATTDGSSKTSGAVAVWGADGNLSEGSSADDGLVSATRSINTSVPLTGGGDLSADLTLAIDTFTGDSGSGGTTGAVPAPSSGDAASGKYLAADGTWSVPIGGGGGGGTIGFSSNNILVAQTTSAFALKGNIVTARQNMTLSYLWANIYGLAGDSYQAVVYEISGTSTIAAILGTSAVFTFGANETAQIIFSVGNISLSAGTKYGIAIQITSGTGTTPCSIDFPGSAGWSALGFLTLLGTPTVAIRHAGVSPGVGTTLSTAVNNGNTQINVVCSL